MGKGAGVMRWARVGVLEARAAAWGRAAKWIPRCRGWRVWRLALMCACLLIMAFLIYLMTVLMLMKFGALETGGEWLPGWVESLQTRLMWVGAGRETLLIGVVVFASSAMLIALLAAGAIVSEGLKASESVSAKRAQETGDLARAQREAGEIESVTKAPGRDGKSQSRRL